MIGIYSCISTLVLGLSNNHDSIHIMIIAQFLRNYSDNKYYDCEDTTILIQTTYCGLGMSWLLVHCENWHTYHCSHLLGLGLFRWVNRHCFAKECCFFCKV